MSFPGGSEDKESICDAGRTQFDPWVRNNLWRREWLLTPLSTRNLQTKFKGIFERTFLSTHKNIILNEALITITF